MRQRPGSFFKTAFFGVFAFSILLGAYLTRFINSTPGDGNIYMEYIDRWTVTDENGISFDTGREYSDERAYSEDFTIVSTLPDNIRHDSLLCFLNRSDVYIYINGELRKDFIRDRDTGIPGGSVKSFYLMVPVSSADSGAELRIKRCRTDWQPEVVPETIVASAAGLYSYMIDRYGLGFVMSAILMVTALLVIIVGLVMRVWYGQRIDMLYAAFGVLVVACWLLSVSYLTPIITGLYYVDGAMGFIFCMMMPFGFLIYLDSITDERYHKCYTILSGASLLSYVLWTILHFTGIQSFQTSLIFIDSVLGMVVVCAFATLIMDLRKGHIRKYKYTAIGFAGFLIFSILEIILLLFAQLKSSELPMLAGLMFLLILVVVQQVDDLRVLNIEKERAIELSNTKTRFLANMSHEIRTPINSILGMNEMILRENHDAVINDYAQNISRSGKMLLSLVNDVLDMSKIESGKIDIIDVDCRLSLILKDITPMLRERAEGKKLDYSIVIDDNVPDGIHTDEIRIKQILINLINNAIKYTDKGSVTLRISCTYEEYDKCRLRFDIMDTGKGIREEDISELFEAFSRVDLRNNRNVEGTGLGLSIVKNVVDAMGGKVNIESEYGRGSVFSVIMPVTVTDRTAVPEDYEKVTEACGKTGGCDFSAPDARILAVDDTPNNLNVISLFLKRTGIEPELCLSGREAVEKCREMQYDLILLDHMMPDPDGIETLKLIRKDEKSQNRETTAVVLTANAVAGSRELYMEAGFEECLTKPLDPEIFEQTVKKYLPKEKIKEAQVIAQRTEETAVSPQEELPNVDGLDWKYALMHLPGRELLGSAVGDFYNCIDLHADKLNRMFAALPDKEACRSYRIQVHGMKNSAATIGIIPLAGMAKELENAAASGNVYILKDLHSIFINAWTEYKHRLEEAFPELNKAEGKKEPMDKAGIREQLEIIRMAMEDFDVDGADEAVARLDTFAYSDIIQSKINVLKAAVADVDDDACNETIEHILKLLEEM